jgi:hypothetical protein
MLSIRIEIRISKDLKRTSNVPLSDPKIDEIYGSFQNNTHFCSITSENKVFLALHRKSRGKIFMIFELQPSDYFRSNMA